MLGKKTPVSKFKPPVKPLYRREPSGLPFQKPDRRYILFPLALAGFMLGVSTLLIYVIIIRGPDTHASLWNDSGREFSRTEVQYVVSQPAPKLTLPKPSPVASPPAASPSPTSATPPATLPPTDGQPQPTSNATPPPSATPPATPAPPAEVSFSGEVLPILKSSCITCHGLAVSFKGVNLTSYQAINASKVTLVAPGRPDDSLLVKALRGESMQMPPTGPLDEDKIKAIAEWIRQGARDN